MSLMPFPWVKQVTIKENKVVLTVQADEFAPFENLELSGYATQNSGAFAVFDVVQRVPEPNPDDTIDIYVTVTPSRPFTKGEAVTVTMRAGPVWVSVLKEPPTGQGTVPQQTSGSSHPESAEEGTTWLLTSASYAEPSSGEDDDQASAGSDGSFQGN
jgi:hypothetical protein